MIRVACVVAVAYVLQNGVLRPLAVGGVLPDLAVVAVIAVACAWAGRPSVVAGVGFVAGLLGDLDPAAQHPAGLGAVALAIGGYAASRAAELGWEDSDRRSARWGAFGLLAAAVTLVQAIGFAALDALVGRDGELWAGVLRAAPTNAIVTGLVAPLLVPPALRFLRARARGSTRSPGSTGTPGSTRAPTRSRTPGAPGAKA